MEEWKIVFHSICEMFHFIPFWHITYSIPKFPFNSIYHFTPCIFCKYRQKKYQKWRPTKHRKGDQVDRNRLKDQGQRNILRNCVKLKKKKKKATLKICFLLSQILNEHFYLFSTPFKFTFVLFFGLDR